MHYIVRIARRSNGRFGWEICRQGDSLVVERSATTFPTRVQALMASVKMASCLAYPLTVNALSVSHDATGAGKSQKPFLESVPAEMIL